MDKILLVLVVYKCDFKESITFKSISAFNKLNGIKTNWLIFDNSATQLLNEAFEFDSYNYIQYKSTGINEGLTKHYNEGFKIALQQNHSYVLLLDQDTHFTLGVLPYIEAIQLSEMSIIVPLIGQHNKLISPANYQFGRGFITHSLEPGVLTLNLYAPINSGSLIHTSAWQLAGGFNEKIKLDFSDYSFFRRVQKAGINQFLLIDYPLGHELSTFEKDSNKIIARFRLYMVDLKAYQEEVGFGMKLLLSFWAFVHALKVVVRTRFNLKVLLIFLFPSHSMNY